MTNGTWVKCSKKDPDGSPCRGIRADHIVKPVQRSLRTPLCLAHLDARQLDQVLTQLEAGCEVDLRGTSISGNLLRRILGAVAEDGVPSLRDANFIDAVFGDGVDFGNTVFGGTTRFRGAEFGDSANFDEARFEGNVADFGAVIFRGVTFISAEFRGDAIFSAAEFTSGGNFTRARFERYLDFGKTRFFTKTGARGRVDFTDATLMAPVNFDGAWCHSRGGFDFSGASFSAAGRLGLLGTDFLTLDRVIFQSPVVIEALASEVSCVQARFEAGFTIRLRYARLLLENAVLAAASSLIGSEPGMDPSFDSLADPDDLAFDNGELAHKIRNSGSEPDDDPWMPVLTSVRGVDVSELTISDADLSQTRFSGAHHLDQLRIGGRSHFAEPPRARRWRGSFRVQWGWPPLWWWTRRQLLAEEAAWRATRRADIGWEPPDGRVEHAPRVCPPETLVAMYRSLRKAQEDTKNEPGAADFYYGEMEMRRHAPSASSGERVVLFLYWLTSGYGLRATRSLGCLLACMAVVALAMHAVGFTGTHTGFGVTVLYVAEAALSLGGGTAETGMLTWQGQLLRILMRLTGPLFIGLTLLSIRNRVKR